MNSIKILIIEDERHIARFLEFVLQKEGYRISVARNGAEGLSAFYDFKPNAVILDLGLPDMNGLEVLKQIRLNDEFAAVKIMVLTATLNDGVSLELNRVGISAQCSKPIAPTTLLSTLQSFKLQQI